MMDRRRGGRNPFKILFLRMPSNQMYLTMNLYLPKQKCLEERLKSGEGRKFYCTSTVVILIHDNNVLI